jgi:hypothetical protein
MYKYYNEAGEMKTVGCQAIQEAKNPKNSGVCVCVFVEWVAGGLGWGKHPQTS